MSDNNDLKALEELAAAIARLEQKLAGMSQNSADNDGIAQKHAALKSDVSAIIRDLDAVIEGARRG